MRAPGLRQGPGVRRSILCCLVCVSWLVVWAGRVGVQTSVIDADGNPVVIRDTSRLVGDWRTSD